MHRLLDGRPALALVALLVFLTHATHLSQAASSKQYTTKSGIRDWVDPETPEERQTYVSSRGRTWELVMSDEFNTPNRSFRPGDDHMWTSLEKPDGVNGALELYSHNMTSTACDDDGTCYFYIKAIDEVNTIYTYNAYLNPPGYEYVDFFYRGAMVQSWNKFCFQGGMLEVSATLPGAVTNGSGNPDLALGKSAPVATNRFYPTWPGIWMMGNLGRAIFTGSTSRMWPFSYNRCEPEVFNPDNQRISACNDTPGFGLNPNQGRGAPEIDLLEGGGSHISSSLQIGPGMPTNFRLFPADTEKYDSTNPYCVYSYNCQTPGANYIDIPTDYYQEERGHKSWYQGLRYAANNFCIEDASLVQSYASVTASVKAGITNNSCTVDTCPASGDVNGEYGYIDNVTSLGHWNINSNGTCFPAMNSYMGAYLCDPDNTNELCVSPRNETTPKTNTMAPFNYQMDAISSNWPIHVGAYLDYLVYQLEWVTGASGYARWMLDGHPIFEISSDAFSNVPQDDTNSNPVKLMLEEPMYVIFNVALSRSWGAVPPNPGQECRGDGKDNVTNAICDAFPMYMKIDYIRLYQDMNEDGQVPDDQYFQVGCDPASHPTKEWIEGHISEYEDADNPVETVAGMGFCTTDEDCTLGRGSGGSEIALATGRCTNNRCACLYPGSWGGPRCSTAVGQSVSSGLASPFDQTEFGPSVLEAGVVTFVVLVASIWTCCYANKEARLRYAVSNAASSQEKAESRDRSSMVTSLPNHSTIMKSSDV